MYIKTKINGFSKVYWKKEICPIAVTNGTHVFSADTMAHQTSYFPFRLLYKKIL